MSDRASLDPLKSVVAVAALAVVVTFAVPCVGADGEGGPALGAEHRAAAERIAAMIAEGKHREAYGPLAALRKRVGQQRHPIIEGLIAEVALLEKRPDRALQHAEPFVIERTTYRRDVAHCARQAGAAYLALARPEDAAAVFRWLVESENDGDLANQLLAAEGLARAELAAGRHDKALEAVRFARRQLQTVAARLAYEQRNDHRLTGADGRLARLEAEIQRERDLERFGPDHMALRDADTHRLARRYVDALAAYRKLIADSPESPYAEIARLHEAVCMLELGGTQQAAVKLEAFIDAAPHGLYRGEALLALAVIDLERWANAEAAYTALARLRAWIADVRQPERAVEPPAVRPEALAAIRPPSEKEFRDFWGNLHFRAAAPGALPSRATAPWYLDDLEARCVKLTAFACMATGRTDEARTAMARLLELDPNTRRLESEGEWNDYRRLMFGVERGHLVAMPDELRLYPKRLRLLVLLGDFYYVTRRFDEAERLAGRMLDGRFGPLTEAQRDYLHFARAQAISWTHSHSAALPHYEAVLAKLEGTFTERRAALAAGIIHLRSGDPARRDHAIALLSELIRVGGDSEPACGARLVLARALHRAGLADRAVRLLRAMPRTAGSHRNAAEFYIAEWTR